MGAGTMRNQPCWCGSGEKYKNCHLKRERKPAVRYDPATKRLKNARERPRCMHPSAGEACSDRGIKAHTVSRRANGLELLARDGHVYGFVPEKSGICSVCLRGDIRSTRSYRAS